MPHRALVAAGVLSVVSLLAIPFPGTIDVRQFWVPWTATLLELGLTRGYAEIADYPPLASVMLWLVGQFAVALGLSFHLAFKLSLWLGLSICLVAFASTTDDTLATVLLWATLALNSVALGYLDGYWAPAALIGIWALLKQRHGLAFTSFLVASFVKWQTLAIWPALVLYLVQHWWLFPAGRRTWSVTIGACAAGVGLLILVFGPLNVWHAFQIGLSHQRPSANALNLGWVLQPFFSDQAVLTRALKMGYLIFVVRVLWVHSAHTLPDPVRTLQIGFVLTMGHVVLNGGAHENHWYLSSLLATCLATVTRSWIPVAVAVAVIGNMNLVLFYGVRGDPVTVPAMVLWFGAVGVVATTVYFAIAYFHNIALTSPHLKTLSNR